AVSKINEGVCHCGIKFSQHGFQDGHDAVDSKPLCPHAEEVISLRERVKELEEIARQLLAWNEQGAGVPDGHEWIVLETVLKQARAALKGDGEQENVARIPWAFCCSGNPATCDCVNQDHGSAIAGST